MSDGNSDSYFVPAPGEAGGSPKPPPGEEAPDAPSGPAAPPPRAGPGQGARRPSATPVPPAPPIPPEAPSPPRQVYVPDQPAATPPQSPPQSAARAPGTALRARPTGSVVASTGVRARATGGRTFAGAPRTALLRRPADHGRTDSRCGTQGPPSPSPTTQPPTFSVPQKALADRGHPAAVDPRLRRLPVQPLRRHRPHRPHRHVDPAGRAGGQLPDRRVRQARRWLGERRTGRHPHRDAGQRRRAQDGVDPPGPVGADRRHRRVGEDQRRLQRRPPAAGRHRAGRPRHPDSSLRRGGLRHLRLAGRRRRWRRDRLPQPGVRPGQRPVGRAGRTDDARRRTGPRLCALAASTPR
jgi:hypothetical protein